MFSFFGNFLENLQKMFILKKTFMAMFFPYQQNISSFSKFVLFSSASNFLLQQKFVFSKYNFYFSKKYPIEESSKVFF